MDQPTNPPIPDMPPPDPTGAPPRTVGDLLRRGWELSKKHLGQTIVFALLGATFAWLANIWLIAREYEGTNVPDAAPVTTDGTWAWGIMFWSVASALIFGMLGYWRTVGTQRFFADLRSLPSSFGRVFRADGTNAWVHFLWGVAVMMVVSAMIAPSVSGAMGIGLLVAIPSVIGRVLISLVSKAWRAIAAKLAPGRQVEQPPIVAVAVAGFGSSLALAVGFLISDQTVKIVIALAVAGLAFVLSQQNRPAGPDLGTMSVLVLMAGAIGAAIVLDPSIATADDGGWLECRDPVTGRTTWGGWLDCQGSDRVIRNAGLGGLFGGLFGGFGSGLGGVAGSFAPPGGDLVQWMFPSDGEQVPEWREFDHDGDGVVDEVIRARDIDGDGVPDWIERDTDGDGTFDESVRGRDLDGDGRIDLLEHDADGDGRADDTARWWDLDGDGQADLYEQDTDGDGKADQSVQGWDTDNDGTIDWIETDTDGDGEADASARGWDFDGDGEFDRTETDIDGDGEVDRTEQRTSLGGHGDITEIDTDGDGIIDRRERVWDADGDGIAERTEVDTDGDGRPDEVERVWDRDGDGIADLIERDTDGDGDPDYREEHTSLGGHGDITEIDTDGDGDIDHRERVWDSDGDGIAERTEIDSDGDGDVDTTERVWDLDGDGEADLIERDTDGDGQADYRERQTRTNTGFIREIDHDNDGEVDEILRGTDLDNDGEVDLWEHDDDGDGRYDRTQRDRLRPAAPTGTGGADTGDDGSSDASRSAGTSAGTSEYSRADGRPGYTRETTDSSGRTTEQDFNPDGTPDGPPRSGLAPGESETTRADGRPGYTRETTDSSGRTTEQDFNPDGTPDGPVRTGLAPGESYVPHDDGSPGGIRTRTEGGRIFEVPVDDNGNPTGPETSRPEDLLDYTTTESSDDGGSIETRHRENSAGETTTTTTRLRPDGSTDRIDEVIERPGSSTVAQERDGVRHEHTTHDDGVIENVTTDTETGAVTRRETTVPLEPRGEIVTTETDDEKTIRTRHPGGEIELIEEDRRTGTTTRTETTSEGRVTEVRRGDRTERTVVDPATGTEVSRQVTDKDEHGNTVRTTTEGARTEVKTSHPGGVDHIVVTENGTRAETTIGPADGDLKEKYTDRHGNWRETDMSDGRTVTTHGRRGEPWDRRTIREGDTRIEETRNPDGTITRRTTGPGAEPIEEELVASPSADVLERNPTVNKILGADETGDLVDFLRNPNRDVVDVTPPEPETPLHSVGDRTLSNEPPTPIPGGIRIPIEVDTAFVDIPAASADLTVVDGRLTVKVNTLLDRAPGIGDTVADAVRGVEGPMQARVNQINAELAATGRELTSVSITADGDIRFQTTRG